MKIMVRHVGGFVTAQVVESSTEIDLGMLNKAERDELAGTFVDAAFSMGPQDMNDCAEWFSDLLKKLEILDKLKKDTP